MQEAQVQSLAWEDCTHQGTTRSARHNYWTLKPGTAVRSLSAASRESLWGETQHSQKNKQVNLKGNEIQ